MKGVAGIVMLILSAATPLYAAFPLPLNLSTNTLAPPVRAWPVMPPLAEPKGLRPCCAFGYDLRADVFGLPVPVYQLNNVVEVNGLGWHQYNDSALAGLANLTGLSRENNGIVYTTRGGFIDTAHVRDTADMTLYIFTHLQARLGQAFTLQPDAELAERRLVFRRFTPPTRPEARYLLATWLAAHLAFNMAEWHEIAQGYGFESVPGFSEAVSAFSPEDLYSNLLGARLAAALILNGQAQNRSMYEVAMTAALAQALRELGARPARITRFQFDMLDGRWWNSQRRVPEKYLVLRRNYQMGDSRVATPVPGEQTPPLRLTLPHAWQGYRFSSAGALQLWPGADMAQLPPPQHYYTEQDFARLAAFASARDNPPVR